VYGLVIQVTRIHIN